MLKGRCRLCLKEGNLLTKSHIIPEFMYKSLYDQHHRMVKAIPREIAKGTGKAISVHSGEYESGILCRHCDGSVIGGYERYSHSVLYGGPFPEDPTPANTNFAAPDGFTFSRCTKVNYTKFKLFLLSILWRASISKRQFFEDVHLGPYEEIIRRMLLDGDPKGPEDFPVILITWLNDTALPKALIGPPSKATDQGGSHYIWPIGGVVYVFYVSPNAIPSNLMPFTILPTEEVSLLHVPLGEGWEFIRGLLKV